MTSTKPMPLGWLPNEPGFRFIGVRRDGTAIECVVIAIMGLPTGERFHTVADYHDLIGWYRLPESGH